MSIRSMDVQEPLKGKKLLIIGGAFQHCKVVETARKMGVITYVTDYLPPEKSPAKLQADHYYMFDIKQIDEIVDACRRDGIDGAISLYLDPCQIPYQQICEKMGFPCFGTREQFMLLTDKLAFKKACLEHGVDVIPEYDVADFADDVVCSDRVRFPVFVKPCDSRGSRGQSICHTREEVLAGIVMARSESSTGNVVIEQYMDGKNDFSLSYIVLDGEPCLYRTGNRFLGSLQDGLNRLCIAGSSPATFSSLYREKVHARVCRMLREIGLKNAPVFMQGFVDGDTVRFYDPGLRFPGIEYERMFERACGLNPIEPMIEFALTGRTSECYKALKDKEDINGKKVVELLVALRPGTISVLEGLDAIRSHPAVVSLYARIGVGDTVPRSGNVTQRLCEIDILTDTIREMQDTIAWIYRTLVVLDEHGRDMVTSRLHTQLLCSKQSEI